MWLLILFSSILGGGWIALMLCFENGFKTLVKYEDQDIKEMREYRKRNRGD